MENISSKLASWLSNELKNIDFKKFICINQSEIETKFSRGVFLKLKQCNRAVGRAVLESIKPCSFCAVTTLDEALDLMDNPNFQYICCSDDTSSEFPKPRGAGPDSCWQCRKCGSITLLVLPEKEFKGWWGKVG
ncbi:TPA: hypothetical protein ACVO40_004601 [Vibrio diabolicus]